MGCTFRTSCKTRMESGIVKPPGQARQKKSRKKWSREKAAKQGWRSGSLDPRGQVCREKVRKASREEQDPLAARSGRRSVPLDVRRTRDENKRQEEQIRQLQRKLERGPHTEPLGGRYNQTRIMVVKQSRQICWRASTGPPTWDLRGLST